MTLETLTHEVGRSLGVPTSSVPLEEAADYFGDPFTARVFATDAPASSARTRALLGWTPTHPTLLEDLRTGDYLGPVA